MWWYFKRKLYLFWIFWIWNWCVYPQNLQMWWKCLSGKFNIFKYLANIFRSREKKSLQSPKDFWFWKKKCGPSWEAAEKWVLFSLESKFIFSLLQLRLDFSSFVITGPSTDTTSAVKTIGGQVKKLILNYMPQSDTFLRKYFHFPSFYEYTQAIYEFSSLVEEWKKLQRLLNAWQIHFQ